ncbi:hypothetical protein E4U57_003673 [Claviceps arundinis]|uniref:Histone H1 n=1 Tax=Claviceps arundinis TaxID=1623583 RepID=A0ABQ7P688_9HYPO|nr:hypothetical protein E4U57_003673 [Claviceps arundinis]
MCNLEKLSARFGNTIQTLKGADCGKATCKHSSNYRPPPPKAAPPKRAKRAKRAQKPGGPGPAAKTIAQIQEHVAKVKEEAEQEKEGTKSNGGAE